MHDERPFERRTLALGGATKSRRETLSVQVQVLCRLVGVPTEHKLQAIASSLRERSERDAIQATQMPS